MAPAQPGPLAAPSGASLRRRLEFVLPVLAVAVLGHLLVLRTWWFHDDWVFLADAAGLAERGATPVRFVSYRLYWHLLYPLWGLATWPWALTRLALHAGNALLVARLAGHAGLDRHGRLLAGLLFAAAPAAFECVYWGTGAVELLGVFLTLASLERWLAGGGRARAAALVLAALAIGSKETGLLLPLVFGLDLARRRAWRTPLAAGVVALLVLAAAAVVLMLGDFATTADYAVDLRHVPRDFLVYGSWLATPGVLLRDATLGRTVGVVTGAAVWLLWGAFARREALRGRPAALVALALAAAALAPATVLGDHAVPRYVYGPSAALAVTLVLALHRERGPSRAALVLAGGLLLVLAWSGTAYHLDARHVSGRAFHRLVFKERVSRYLCAQFRAAGVRDGDRVVIVQDASTDAGMRRVLEDAMAGDLALRLTVGPRASLVWKRTLAPEDAGAVVFCTRGENLVPRGRYRP